MLYLNQSSISVRLLLLGGLPLLLLVASLLLTYQASTHKDSLFDRLYSGHLVLLDDLLQTQRLLEQEALDGVQRYRAGWLSDTGVTQEVEEHLSQAETHWSAYRKARGSELNALEQQVEQQLQAALVLYQQWLEPIGSDALQVRILNTSTVNHQIGERLTPLGQGIRDLVAEHLQAAEQVQSEAAQLTNWQAQAYLLGGGLLVLSGILLAWRVQVSIQRPLLKLYRHLTQVQQQSDLTLRLSLHGKDEIAQTAQAVNGLLEHFHQLIQETLTQASQLKRHASNMHEISSEISSEATDQAGEARSLASAMQQLNLSIQDIADSAVKAEQQAKAAENLTDQGSQQVDQAQDSIEQLAQVVEAATHTIAQLNQDANGIFQVLEVIETISAQTNLLALNAAIEAARAGEAGRGFAVVADEVRSLSANTSEATGSINASLQQLQSQAHKAVEAMQKASQQVEVGVSAARASNQALDAIRGSVAQISQGCTRISAATEQQKQAVTLSHQGIDQLDQGITRLSQEASRSTQLSSDLEDLSRSVRNQVRLFKVQ